MKIATTLLFLLLPLQEKDPDQARLTCAFKETPLDKVLEQIQKMTTIPIEWTDEAKKKVDPKGVTIDIDIKDLSVTQVLKLLLISHGLDVKAVDKKKVLISAP
jgi:hypothetical protein